jgi:hypothetical protein
MLTVTQLTSSRPDPRASRRHNNTAKDGSDAGEGVAVGGRGRRERGRGVRGGRGG